MVSYIVLFLVIAVLAGVLGFGGIAVTAGWIAEVLFVVALVFFLGSLISAKRPSL